LGATNEVVSGPIRGAAWEGVGLFRLDCFELRRGLCEFHVIGGRRGWLACGFEFLVGEDEAADVAEWLFPNSHLFEVILPDSVGGGAGGAAGEGFALDRDDFPVRVEAGVFLRWEEEGDLGALFPEVAGELVGKEQGVIAAAGRESGDGGFEAWPFGLEAGLVPLPELKAVHTSAEHDDADEFFTSHGIFWRGVEVTPSGSTLGGPNGNAEAAPGARGKWSRLLIRLVQELPSRESGSDPFR